MTDIIEKLRRYAGDVCLSTSTELEAADIIERLRAQVEEEKRLHACTLHAAEDAAREIERLRAENAELFEAMQHLSYEEENRLLAELSALKAQEPLIIAAALYDFGGWLTSRDEQIVASATDNAGPMADAIKEFCAMRGIDPNQELPILSWHEWVHAPMFTSGQISNHYEAKDWELFAVPETESALYEFDGHTGEDVIARLSRYAPTSSRDDEALLRQCLETLDPSDATRWQGMAKIRAQTIKALRERLK